MGTYQIVRRCGTVIGGKAIQFHTVGKHVELEDSVATTLGDAVQLLGASVPDEPSTAATQDGDTTSEPAAGQPGPDPESDSSETKPDAESKTSNRRKHSPPPEVPDAG